VNPLPRKLTYEEILSQALSLEEVKDLPKRPIVGVVDNVRSLHNVGAIFRTADGAGLEKLYLCGITGTPPRNEIRKTSLGAEDAVDWEYQHDVLQVIRKLKNMGYKIVALEHTTESVDFQKANYNFPLCLVVGHEHHGISEKVVELADLAIEIPMYGFKQSLNVSVAFGVAVFQILQHL
jgi:tRNA G18 (ribose-2'-O)-methylase SpoU